MADLSLGPFLLETPIGSGAMGEVWKARHKDRGTPAAIKVLLGKQATQESRLKGFFNETRAVAQLDHPGIAWVLDYGTISEEAALATDGKLVANSPYLAMEYASRGTLADVDKEFNWSELRAILLALLDALAHAHARGVIHRDLKPANVLLCGRKDLRPGIKLCDFGIAFAMEEARDDQTVAGTLHYMAPEQLEGRQREQGPWTDLYALGCLTWRMLTGKPPFAGKRQTQLMFAQLQEDPPVLISPTPMPDGFEEWLRTLLAKEPLHRFRCAADAARALSDLGHPSRTMPDEDLRTGIIQPVVMTRNLLDQMETEPVTALEDLADLTAQPTTLFMDGATIAWKRPGLASSVNQVRAGLPLDWRRPARHRPILDLVGAGLKLFGLRKAAFTGREAERDTLWDLLAKVHTERRARGVFLQGESGTGKTRLANWVAERAAEVGGANVLSARFSGADDADGALKTMLLRRFSALGLEGDDLKERLEDALDDLGITNADLRKQSLALLGGRQLQGASRYVVIRLLLEAISRDRPVVLVLDDLHAGIDGLRFARHLHNAQAVRPFPILLLMTVRPDLLEHNNLVAETEALRADKRVTELDVGPLPREPFMELVQDLLGLEPDLARQVVDRTAGNPLFAIQLVGDWIERDQLELGSRGFKLKRGVRAQLPPSLKYVWVKRLARVLEDADDSTQQLLEAAAVLGMEVDEFEWSGMADDPEGVHRQAGRVAVNPDLARRRRQLINSLLQLNLAEETEQGFAFTHGQFRDAILDRARAYKRLRAHHRAAACQLGVDVRDTELERYGRHLLAAGEREAALDPLLRAVPAVQATVGRMSAWRLLDTVEHALKKLDLPRSDIRWGRMYIERAQLAEYLGRTSESVKWAAKAGSEASRHRWTTIAAAANFRLARDAMRRGDLDMANARLVRVTNQIDPNEEPFMVGEALFLLGNLGRRQGEPKEEIDKLLKAGRTWMLKDSDPRKRVRALVHLARAALEAGQPGTCAALTERARKVAIELGDLPQQVQCLAYAAEVARENGQLQAAAAKLRRAIEVFELIGDAQLALLRCNLAIVQLDQGNTNDALKELDRGLSNAIEVDRIPLRLAVQSVRLRALADAGRMADLDEAIRACRSMVSKVRVGQKDSARSAEMAYQLLLGAGEEERAQHCLVIAVDQYTKIRDDDAVARLTGANP